jgi:uncharacterized membrane protein YbaN (DUF454 family)
MAVLKPNPAGTENDPAQVVANPIGRVAYLLLGFICLGLGIAGYIVPLLPGTVFLLLATFFFFRSSERMYHWVLNHPRFGELIRNYRAGHGIPRRIKVYAIALIVVSFFVSVVYVAESALLRALLIACGLGVSIFIVTRPTTEKVLTRVG